MVDFGSDILDTEVPEIEPLDVDISSEPQHELTMALTSGSVKSSSPVVFDFSLQSRVEVILNAIINDLVYGEHPKSRVEQILLYILGEENELPKPHSRVEELLIDLALELESTDISPKSRVEQILLVLLNQPYEFPITHSRVEELLIQLQTHVSEVTGPLPLTINSDGTALIDYRIYGNTVQTGTPTPENPIMPEGVGERTENLFDKDNTEGIENEYYIDRTTGNKVHDLQYYISAPIAVTSEETYCWIFSLDGTVHGAPTAGFFDASDNQIGVASHGAPIKNFAFTTPVNCAYIRASVYKYDIGEAMLVKGSTAPTSYIPYGYKLPMVSRTENLWDSELEQGSFNSLGQEFPSSARIRSDYIHIQNSDNYTITLTGAKGVVVYVYDANKNFLPSESTVGWQALPFTREIEAERHVRFVFAKKSSGSLDTIVPSDVSKIMLTEGSAAPTSYIPYYREETPIYLGESQTTRRVKKLVLTGEESWSTYLTSYYITVNDYYRMYDVGSHLSVCSHYPIMQTITLPEMHYCLGGLVDGQTYTRWNGNIVFNPSPTISSRTDWQSYLAQQYAAGTPVTVWYVLKEPETGIVNEPLMKIGDYTETISMEQAGVSIPTIKGTTVIDYDGTPKPSQMYVKYNES